MSILTFFLTNSILMHCYYAFFTRPNVTLYCVLLTSHWFYYTFQGYQRLHISYLFIHADRQFYLAGKSGYIQQLKIIVENTNKKQRYATIFTPSYRVLFIFFLTFILITQVNNLYHVFSRLIKNIPVSFRLCVPHNSRHYCVFVAFHSKFTVLLR